MRLLLSCLLVAALGLTPSSLPGAAQAETVAKSRPAPSWQVNGRVLAVKIMGNTVIVGGEFTRAVSPSGAKVPRRNLAAFSMRTGKLLTHWRADAGAPVRAIEGAGKFVFVAGSFGQVAGVTRRRLAKLEVATGAVDPTFRPRFNGSIRAIDLDARAVYVGGSFTRVNGKRRLRLAKVSVAGVLDSKFKPRANRPVYGLAKPRRQGIVYASGEFSKLNGSRRNGVGAVKAHNGATTRTVFAKAARPTFGLSVNPNGTRLYGAGGTFTNVAAAWNTKTGARTWRVQAMGDIQAIEFHGGVVYMGFHDGFQGNRMTKMLAVSAVSGVVNRRFRPSIAGFWGVLALDVSKRGVVAGGGFSEVSGVPARGWVRYPR